MSLSFVIASFEKKREMMNFIPFHKNLPHSFPFLLSFLLFIKMAFSEKRLKDALSLGVIQPRARSDDNTSVYLCLWLCLFFRLSFSLIPTISVCLCWCLSVSYSLSLPFFVLVCLYLSNHVSLSVSVFVCLMLTVSSGLSLFLSVGF